MEASQTHRFLRVLCGAWECALPLHTVGEIMRPLPLEAMADAPDGVLGLATIRGTPVPVVDLRALLGAPDPGVPTRYVTLRTPTGSVALAVDAVSGVALLPMESWQALPPLLRDAARDRVEALAARDGQFMMILDAARLIPEGMVLRG